MFDLDFPNDWNIDAYTRQFGPPFSRGRFPFKWILVCYIANDFVYDENKILSSVCERRNIKKQNLILRIRRFIQKSWSQGFTWEWKHFAGWEEDNPPKPRIALRLFCEGYAPFVMNYIDIIQNTPSYYLQNAIVESEIQEEGAQ